MASIVLFYEYTWVAWGKELLLLSSLYFCCWLYYEQERDFEYPLILIWAIIGALFVVQAKTLLFLFLALELQTLSSCILIAFKKKNIDASEAALKYFLSGALSTGCFLFGLSFLFAQTGELSFQALLGNPIPLIFILSSLAIKLGAAPFHWWIPDIYQGSSVGMTAFLAIIPKVSISILLLKMAQLSPSMTPMLLFLSISSLLVGCFGGLLQTNIKRLLAYSSIHNMGFIMLGIAVGQKEGFRACFCYLTIYALNLLTLFSLLIYLKRRIKSFRSFSDLEGLGAAAPLLSLYLAITVFSIAGLPLFPGFLGKFLILKAAFHKELYALCFVSIITSVIALVYYLRFIKSLYFSPNVQNYKITQIPFFIQVLVLTTLGASYFLYLFPHYVLQFF